MRKVTDKDLIDLLRSIDPYISRKVYLIAIGGTALTLLELKPSTLDIDFNLPREEDSQKIRKLFRELDFERINRNKWISPNGLIIDLCDLDYIFCVQLPESSIENSVLIKEFEHISLKALNLYDLIISKLARSETKDMDDIITVFQNRKINPEKLFHRYRRTMEFSLVKDAKENILMLFRELKSKKIAHIGDELLKEVEEWNP